MGKNKKGNQKQAAQKSSASSTTKNANHIFKVASGSGGKKSQKKAKEIPKKLKQLDLKTKEKADQQLKNLHLKMVSKKEVKESAPVGRKKQPAPSTDKVQAVLNKMNVK